MKVKYNIATLSAWPLMVNKRRVSKAMANSAKMNKPDVKLVLLGDMNVGKTSLLHRYMERKFQETVSTVGGAFFLKQWGPYNISIWDTAGREQFHGLGSMYCRGAAAIILTYDVTSWQSLVDLEERFLLLTDTANDDCLYVIVGNKADLTDPAALEEGPAGAGAEPGPGGAEPGRGGAEPGELRPIAAVPSGHKQVQREDAMALYGRVLRYKQQDEASSQPADRMCFETSAKTGYNVDLLFETLFSMALPSILRKRSENSAHTVDLEECRNSKRSRRGCCS
ncbi:ras-related protein Rab-20-like [Conger conger]|uniref:ras-related protein Rab-20-like n=1 Tax=Conger conger TaxID=82655 RepID=UPI002A5AADE7|nr:ras-related protein Rab-20-like [Conger conger]